MTTQAAMTCLPLPIADRCARPAAAKSSAAVERAWLALTVQAQRLAVAEPLLSPYLHAHVLDHGGVASALCSLLSSRLAAPPLDREALRCAMQQCLAEDPAIVERSCRDMTAALERDPAADDLINLCLNQKGYQSLQAYRIAHHFWMQGRRGLALYLQGRVAEVLGLDIHPAARIGGGIFIDHGCGVVIGETAVVSDDVTIFQNVTLGGTGKHRGDRHPKVDRGAMICAGAKILGNIRIGAHAKVGAGSVVLHDVPPQATVVGVPAAVVIRRPVVAHVHADAVPAA